jgi:hypothetical protein
MNARSITPPSLHCRRSFGTLRSDRPASWTLQGQPRYVIGSPRLDLALEVQRQLLAEEQILGGELRAWSQCRQQRA